MKLYPKIAAILSLFALASAGHAVVIDFTGGTATRTVGGPVVTAGNAVYNNVDYYEENGFHIDFVGNPVLSASASYIGTYYGGVNDVIHGHWNAPPGGGLGTLTRIVVTKIGGGTFDLNYFILTSNTRNGGGPASGNEQAWIVHDGNLDPIMLPPENWGLATTSQIFLPSSYDAVNSFEFYVTSDVDCFGMDEFYINEPAPPSVPDAGSALPLLGISLAALAGFRRIVRSKKTSKFAAA